MGKNSGQSHKKNSPNSPKGPSPGNKRKLRPNVGGEFIFADVEDISISQEDRAAIISSLKPANPKIAEETIFKTVDAALKGGAFFAMVRRSFSRNFVVLQKVKRASKLALETSNLLREVTDTSCSIGTIVSQATDGQGYKALHGRSFFDYFQELCNIERVGDCNGLCDCLENIGHTLDEAAEMIAENTTGGHPPNPGATEMLLAELQKAWFEATKNKTQGIVSESKRVSNSSRPLHESKTKLTLFGRFVMACMLPLQEEFPELTPSALDKRSHHMRKQLAVHKNVKSNEVMLSEYLQAERIS